MNEDKIKKENRLSKRWYAITLVIAIFAVLVSRIRPGGDNVDILLPVVAAVGAIFLVSWQIAASYGRAGYSDALAAELGLQRKGLLFMHAKNSALLGGEIEKLPVELRVFNDESRTSRLYGLSFLFQVGNTAGLSLAVFRDGLLNHPLGFLPAKAPQPPDWMARQGIALRAEPESALPGLLPQLELLAPFAESGEYYVRLRGREFEISMKRRDRRYDTPEIKDLLGKASKAARLFA